MRVVIVGNTVTNSVPIESTSIEELRRLKPRYVTGGLSQCLPRQTACRRRERDAQALGPDYFGMFYPDGFGWTPGRDEEDTITTLSISISCKILIVDSIPHGSREYVDSVAHERVHAQNYLEELIRFRNHLRELTSISRVDLEFSISCFLEKVALMDDAYHRRIGQPIEQRHPFVNQSEIGRCYFSR